MRLALSEGQGICLVKVDAPMNLIGAGLKRLSQPMAFGPGQCVLVFDGPALPPGSALRQNGSAGGHRGVASILEAFQTDAFRRIKIGVGSEVARDPVKYVLTAFDDRDRTSIDVMEPWPLRIPCRSR